MQQSAFDTEDYDHHLVTLNKRLEVSVADMCTLLLPFKEVSVADMCTLLVAFEEVSVAGMCTLLLAPCLDHLQILSFFTLSPSHQFLAVCMEH